MATTPNMSLNLPTPTVTVGPTYATQNNAAFEAIDTHDHSTGKGVKVKPDGLNINTDLDIQSNNLNNVASTRLIEQPSVPVGASDIRSLYSYQGNLYYNNDNGDAVRITSGTAIDASTVGGIGGDYGTTSAVVSYINASKKYDFDTDTNRKGALDAGALTIRETDVLNSNGVTLQAPAALAASYSLTLPGAVPASTQLLTMSNTGVLDFADTDETTLETTGAGVLQVKDLGITTSKISNSAVTEIKIGSQAVTNSKLGLLSVSSGILQDDSVTRTKVNYVLGANSISTGLSASVTLSTALEDAKIFFDGGSAYWVGNGAGPNLTTFTWTGPSGVITNGTIVNQQGANSMLYPLSAFSLQIAGVAAAGTYTLTFGDGSITGGTIRYTGVA